MSTTSLKVGRVEAILEERYGSLCVVFRDSRGNEMVIQAQCTSADRLRIEPLSKKGIASIDVHETSQHFYRQTRPF